VVANFYTAVNGNLSVVAHRTGLTYELLKRNKPKDAYDFGKKVLNGTYTADRTRGEFVQLRQSVKDTLQDGKQQLKRTTTKEMNGEAMPDDVRAIVKVYDEAKGDLDVLAKRFGIDPELLKFYNPPNGEAFARSLLGGAYMGDETEMAKSDLRNNLKDDIKEKQHRLKRTTTKEATMFGSATVEEVHNAAYIYESHNGDLAKIAAFCGLSLHILQAKPPKDPNDFARNLLDGSYTTDKTESTKAKLRQGLRGDLQAGAAKLKRTQTKECQEIEPTHKEIDKIGHVFTHVNGNIDEIARICKLPLHLLHKYPPKTAEEFARNLFKGCYLLDSSESVKATFRKQLQTNLARQATVLKRTQTKTCDGSALPEDVMKFAKLYTQYDGDLNKIAQLLRQDAGLLKKNPPKNAEDFARRLLNGEYMRQSPEQGETTEGSSKVSAKKLREDLQEAASQLKEVETPEPKPVKKGDIEIIASVYSQFRGNAKRLAEEYGISEELLLDKPPSDGEDFAHNLLVGTYTVDVEELAKTTLRNKMKDGLQRQATKLKRTTTKEAQGIASPEEIEYMADLYRKQNGDLEKLARLLGLTYKLIRKNPPTDPVDFARKIFVGTYVADLSEHAKAELRSKLAWELKAMQRNLKRTVTKEYDGIATPAELKAFAQIYTDQAGNLDMLSAIFGVNPLLMREYPPKDGIDFAKKLLAGAYTGDYTGPSESAHENATVQMDGKLTRQASTLKRTTTKTFQGPADDDVRAVSDVYTRNNGDLEKLADMFGFSVDDLEMNPPVDAIDFANKVLLGAYTTDQDEKARQKWRDRLDDDLQKTGGALKRTQTKENAGPTEEELEFCAKRYNQFAGDPAQLADAFGINERLVEMSPPRDGYEFAKKLLDGAYTEDTSEYAKAALRETLKEQLSRSRKLKKTRTRTASGEAFEEDIELFGQVYTKCKGNFSKIAQICGCREDLLQMKPPKNGKDFAKKLLEGAYTGESTIINKAQFRDVLRDNVIRQGSCLKRTTTKTFSGPSDEDLELAAGIFTRFGGDIDQIADACGIDAEAMILKPPMSAHDFAMNLLTGAYQRDRNEVAKAELRDSLEEMLHESTQKLKRTVTKEAAGEPSADDYNKVAQLYKDAGNGNLPDLARVCGIEMILLERNKPRDARDFAQKLFAGAYSAEGSEVAKASLRQSLENSLQRKASMLKRTHTRMMSGEAIGADIQAAADVYKKYGGDLGQLAKAFKLNPMLIQQNPPRNAEDFGKKVMEGVYTGETSELARSLLRSGLRQDIYVAAGKLKRTQTKENEGPSQSELDWCALIYNKQGGDLEGIAEHLKDAGVSAQLLAMNRPTSAMDFAKNLLAGVYTVEQGEANKKELRTQLRDGLQACANKLKRTVTKEAKGIPSEEEIEFLAGLYSRHGGDRQLLSDICGVDKEFMDRHAPVDARDWAIKILNGTYTADMSEAAKAVLRGKLQNSLQHQRWKLKRTATKEMCGHASTEDIEAFSKVYTDNKGDLEALAKTFGVNVQLMKRSPPTDARDFAKKLLAGSFTGETTENQKVQLRDRLRGDLKSASKALKRTHTKEYIGPSAESIAGVAQMYDTYCSDGDLSRVAQYFGVSEDLLNLKPPRNGTDFARKLLTGAYTPDATETAKNDLRSQLQQGLKRTASQLKRTVTKTYQGPSEQEIQFMEKLFVDHHGNLEALSRVTGLTLKLMISAGANNARDWATKGLDGTYSADMPETAKMEMRKKLSNELSHSRFGLKRTKTKVMDGTAMPEDVARLAEVYTKAKGDLDKLARMLGASSMLLKKNPPKDANDFGKKILEGSYTAEVSKFAKQQLQQEKPKDDLQRTASQLKRTTTKTYSGIFREDLEAIMGVYNKHNGDLDALAQVCGISPQVLKKHAPKSAEEFAKGLLEERFVQDGAESAKADLRQDLMGALQRTASKLKRTATKEGTGPTQEELTYFGNLYREHSGDLEKVSRTCGISLKLLRRTPPRSGDDFAKKVMEGTYQANQSEQAKAEFRSKLAWELKCLGSRLKRTKTKVMTGDALPEDIRLVAEYYAKQNGDINKLVLFFGINEQLVRLNMPKSAEEFAKKMLEGHYTGEVPTQVEVEHMRIVLKDQITRQQSTLKRTRTKEYTGHASEDLMAIEKLYNDNGGDIVKLADVCGVPQSVIKNNKPKNAREFAEKLLSGMYAMDKEEAGKAELRGALARSLTNQRFGLKRTMTRQYSKEMELEDMQPQIEYLVKLYRNNGGDLEKLARITGCTIKLLKRSPPQSPEDFAKKMIDGTYQADRSEAVKAEMRDKLRWELKVQERKGLKRTVTKEATGEASFEDVQALSAMYNRVQGDITKLSQAFKIPEHFLKKVAPSDGDDFARKLLAGVYTQEGTAVAQEKLRTDLRGDLQRSLSSLKRTATKEYSGPGADELTAAAKIFDAHKGDLLRISKHCNIDYDTLVRHKPKDSLAFAKELLAGTFTVDQTAQAKADLRSRLQGDLRRTASQLKRVATREYAGPTPEEIAYVAKLYDNQKGDLQTLARLTNLNLKLLQKQPPVSGTNFAENLFRGMYTSDKTEDAKKELRTKLLWECKAQSTQLKRTVTRVGDGLASKEDVDAIAQVWEQHKGNLDKIATVTGARLELIVKFKPRDARDFAKKLLEGVYSGNSSDLARQDMRTKLREDLQFQSAQLREVQTNEHKPKGEAITKKECTKIAKIWEDGQGDSRSITKIQEICKICGCNDELVLRNFPFNGEDFARKLFEGIYTGDVSKDGKTQLRTGLRDGLLTRMGTLKRTNTKTYQGPVKEEIDIVSQIYTANKGDLNKIAQICGIPPEVIKSRAPKDANEFAVNLLEGVYNCDTFEVAKSNLRSKLSDKLKDKRWGLKKTVTKVFEGASDDEIAFVGKLYTDNQGNLEAMAEITGLSIALLRASPPSDATDFGRRLLAGTYTSDKTEAAKQDLRDRMRLHLANGCVSLKRTATKEWQGKADAADVEFFTKIFTDYGGDMRKLAEAYSLNLSAMQKHPPVSPKDWARKLLLGTYTVDVSAQQATDFRSTLNRSLTSVISNQDSSGKPALKRTQTKVHSGRPEAEEVVLVAKVYDKMEGNLKKLADYFGASYELIFMHQPKNGNEFADSLLSGSYSDETSDAIRRRLKGTLKDELANVKGKLKRTQTKVGAIEPEAESVAACAMIWEEHEGDLDKIAARTGCSAALLKASVPRDGMEFGRNYLLGKYCN